MRLRLAILIAPCVLSAPLFSGCAAPQAPTSAPVADLPPPDFTLGFAVLNRTARRNVDALPREHRPARFVIETDWVLRSYAGRAADTDTFPPETRQLDADEIDAIWSDLRAAGLLDPAHPAIVGPPPTQEEVETPVWVLVFTAGGDRRTFTFEPGAEAVRPLLSRLADLAWMPE